jgi:CubicO group peptidase (beta-lactamase class C family)
MGKAAAAFGFGIVFVIAVLCGIFRPDNAIRVGTGNAAHTICSETFVSGFDPNVVFAQAIARYPGLDLLARGMHVNVDRANRSVEVDWRGMLKSRAIYRDKIGCLLLEGSGPIDQGVAAPSTAAAFLPDIAGPDVVEPSDPRLRAAFDRMFVEPAKPPHRWVKAVVVVKDGRVIAERYAPGVSATTPLLGYSASKSFINALVGILVREGKLNVGAPVPVAAWRNDTRSTITLDNLLRMTSGLAIAQTGSGFDPASRMLYGERDMAGFAESRPLQEKPGTAMRYSDASALIVSRIVRDAVGGNGAAVQSFARRELFDPLGMKSVVMEMDATGTPIGSTHIFASGRDWARLGLLYLNDGVVSGRRILPEGWVRYSRTSTLGTSYGAGFWTNDGMDADARGRIEAGMPCDAFFASGNLGQRVYIMPSRKLVIVRLGVTPPPDYDIAGDLRFIRDVLATLPPAPAADCRH